MRDENKINVLLVQPMKAPKMVTINDSLESMQRVVGGRIEEYMPFEDDVALVCNEEGKMNGMQLNRGIFDEQGNLQDIIAGDFFIAYAPIESEKFLSLPEDLTNKYAKRFEKAEQFMMMDGAIKAIPFDAKKDMMER